MFGRQYMDDGEDATGEIKPEVLAALEKTQPDLVQQYREKMAASKAGLASAQNMQDMGNYGNLAGRVLNDLTNANKSDVILKNRYQDLGKAPSVIAAKRPGYDDSIINNMTSQGVSRAKDDMKLADAEFSQEQTLVDLGSKRDDAQKVRDTNARMNDPKSAESAAAREYLKKIVPTAGALAGFDNMTAAQVEKMSPGLYKAHHEAETLRSQEAYRREMAAQTAKNREAIRNERNDRIADERRYREEIRKADEQRKTDEKMEQLRVGDLGYAQTADDAKQLKDATEQKKSFDAKLDELIKLRNRRGVEYWDREAVARGKQLSKELLIDYKNLAKLGVLSQSDEAIINAIIPSDPLGQDWMPGQDSILHQMEKWKSDIERDYQAKINNRLRKDKNTAEGPPKKASSGVHGKDLP